MDGLEITTLLCPHCGTVLNDENTRVDERGNLLCDLCRYKTLIRCNSCGRNNDDTSLFSYINGEYLCAECTKQRYFNCPCCKDVKRRSDKKVIHLNDGTTTSVCYTCANKYYRNCPICSKWYEKSHCYTFTQDFSRPVCDDCKTHYTTICPLCNYLGDGDFTKIIADNYERKQIACHLCRKAKSQSPIMRGYHHSHNYLPLFMGGIDNGKELFMGVELEIDKGDDRDDLIRRLDKQFPFRFVAYERDGSLTDGLELITQPATYKFHASLKAKYRNAFATAIEYGYRSHDAGNCGIHVHVNRSYFGTNEEECIAKILYIFQEHWEDIVKFSRRGKPSLKRWADKHDGDLKDVIKQQRYGNANRYHAVNLANSQTIEFRVFRGTLNIETFFAILQLVNNICKICKKKPMSSIQRMKFTSFLKNQTAKRYWYNLNNKRNRHLAIDEVPVAIEPIEPAPAVPVEPIDFIDNIPAVVCLSVQDVINDVVDMERPSEDEYFCNDFFDDYSPVPDVTTQGGFTFSHDDLMGGAVADLRQRLSDAIANHPRGEFIRAWRPIVTSTEDF